MLTPRLDFPNLLLDNPDPPILAFFVFLAFFVLRFSFFLVRFSILSKDSKGSAEKEILVFCRVILAFVAKKARIGGSGNVLKPFELKKP